MDGYGRKTVTTYNGKGSVIETRTETFDENLQPKWLVTRMVYDARGLRVLTTDSYIEGSAEPIYATQNLYDDRGRGIGSLRREGVVVSLASSQTSITQQGTGFMTNRAEYDDDGRAYKQVGVDGRIGLTEYDSRDRVSATLGMHVLASSVGLPNRGANNYVRLRTETQYNAKGQAYRSIQNIFEYGQVVNGVFVKSTLAADTVRTEQRVTESFYDQNNRIYKTQHADGSFTEKVFDDQNRVVAELDQLNRRIDYTFDTSGRLTQVQLPQVPNPLGGGALARPTFGYEYNASGQMTKLTDSNANVSNFGFDQEFKPTSRSLPSGVTETFEYDTKGRETLHVTFEGIRKRTVYDDSIQGGGRVLRMELFRTATDYNTFMNGGTANGNLAVNVRWERMLHTYDTRGRMIVTQHQYISGANSGAPATIDKTDQWTSTYDAKGQMTREISPTGVIGYEYDSLGRKQRMWSGPVGATSSANALTDNLYTYDAFGQLKTVTTVTRDGLPVDTNSTLAGNQPELTSYHYDLLGRPDYTELPNGVVEDYLFDNMDRMDVMKHYASDSDNSNLTDNAIRAIYDYDYDPDLNSGTNNPTDGKRYGLTETFYTTTPVTNAYKWKYDDAGRLIEEDLDSTDNTLDRNDRFDIDLMGNRVRRRTDKPGTVNDTTEVSIYDSRDRLQSQTTYEGIHATGTPATPVKESATFTWNETQQASKSTNVPSTSTVVQHMTYGLAGQLEKVVTENFSGTGTLTSRNEVAYRYDAQGIRFSATDRADTNLGTAEVDGPVTGRTEYLIDHNNFTGFQQVLTETKYNGSDQATQRITYSIGLDEISQTTSSLNPTTGQVVGTPQTLVFGHDGHGSTRVLFDAAAAMVQAFTYLANGELLAIHNATGTRISGTAATLANPADALTSLLYNGEGIDTRTGMYNFRARWYSPQAGRFDRLDPFAGNPNDPRSFNKYSLAHGDPIQGSDPTGMFFGLGGMMASIGNMNVGQSMNTFMVYTGRQAAMAGIETGIEILIGNLLSLVFGIKFDNDPQEVKRTFTTNFVSNFLTAGIGNKGRKAIMLRNVIDFSVRMFSDVYIAGQNVYLAAAMNLMSFGASALLLAKYGQKIFGECVGRFGGCFVAGTPVVLGFEEDYTDVLEGQGGLSIATMRKTKTKAIESIQLGNRVIAELPTNLPRESEFGEPDQETWKTVHLLQHRVDGAVIDMQLLRPQWWINLFGLTVGMAIELPFSELQTVGFAKVMALGECPKIESGDGEIVIGRFVTRHASNLLTVTLENGARFTGTDSHPVWSEDQQAWKRMDELAVGEGLLSVDGVLNVTSLEFGSAPADVFNIEVDSVHSYRVSECGVLVHNARYGVNTPDNFLRQWASQAGGYIDIVTNKWKAYTGALAADHVFPAVLISKLKGYDELLPAQKAFLMNHPNNFEPFPINLNSSKGGRTAKEWRDTPLGSQMGDEFFEALEKRQEAFKAFCETMMDRWAKAGDGLI